MNITLKDSITLFLLSLFIMLAGTALFNGFQKVIPGDAAEYEGYADSILQGKGFVLNIDGKDFYAKRPPLYPLFLSAVFFVFGHSYPMVKILQAVMAALTVVLTYHITLKITGRKAALISGIISSFYFAYIYGVYMHFADNIFTFMLAVSVYFLVRAETGIRNYILSGIFLSLASLARPTTVIMPFVLFPWFFLKNQNAEKAFKNFCLFLFGFIIILLPWTLRNYSVFNSMVPVHVRAGETLWASNNPWSKGRATQEHSEFANDPQLSELGRDNLFKAKAVEYLKTLPFTELIKLSALKTMTLLYPFMSEYGFRYDPTFGFIIPFWLYGIWLLFKTRDSGALLLLFVLLTFYITTIMFYGGEIRFRIAYSPYLITAAALGILKTSEKLKTFYANLLVFASLALVNIYVFFYYKQIYDLAKTGFEMIRGL